MEITMRIAGMVQDSIVDGPGLRFTLFTQGCPHNCPGCHNPASWPFDAGEEKSVEDLMKVIQYNRFHVTFSGGDPMYQAADLLPLAKAITEMGLKIWCYTGFHYEKIRDKSPYKELLEYIDVLVDGPYVEALKPIGPALRFRGSSNQRFIRPATGEELVFE